MSSKEAYKKRKVETKERRFMKTTYIFSLFIAIIFIMILIIFKIFYAEISTALDLVSPIFFAFIRVLFSIGTFIFLYIGFANLFEYKRMVISWVMTILLFISISIFIYFMFDFPGAPAEMILTIIGGVAFVFYLYLIQD
jgi:predicted tellurium resistance membrane protein TerC